MTVNTLGSDERAAKPRNAAWLWPLLPVAVSMFALAALVSYQVRANGGQLPQSLLQSVVVGIYSFVGFVPAFFFFLLVLSWSSIWFMTGRLEKPGARVLRLLALTLALAIWVNLQPEGSEASPAAGALGNWIGARMVSTLGRFLSVLVVAPLALAALLLATDFFFYRFFEGVHAQLDQLGPDQFGQESGDGVEPDVSEHFKGLSQVLAPHPVREAAPIPSAMGPSAGAPAAGRRVSDPVVGDRAAVVPPASPAVTPAGTPPALDPTPVARRESHFERRQREERERAFAPIEPETGELETGEPEMPDAVPSSGGSASAGPASVLSDGPEAPASPPADDEFSIAAALTDQLADEAPELTADARADATATGGVARPWGSAVVDDADDADDDEDDEDDLDETAAPDPDADEDSEEAAAIRGLDGDAIVVLEPTADVVTRADDVLREFAASDDADLVDAAAAPGTAEAEVARIEPVEARGDGVGDEAARPTAEETAGETTGEAAGLGKGDAEPVVAIPRPAEGVRQQRLFVTTVDEALVREAVELVTSARRASVALLQRKLQIDFEQAMEVLAVLARRGVIDLAAGETQGRVR